MTSAKSSKRYRNSTLSKLPSLFVVLAILLATHALAFAQDLNSGDNYFKLSRKAAFSSAPMAPLMQVPTVESGTSQMVLTKPEIPALIFPQKSEGSFLSRLFPASPNVVPDSEMPSISSKTPTADTRFGAEPRTQRSSTIKWLFIGGVALSWGLIFLLILQIMRLRNVQRKHEEPQEGMTSTSYQILGVIAAEHKKFQLAEQCYRQVSKIEPYNKEIHQEIGKVLFHAERYKEAIKEFHIALGSEVISPELYGFLAKAYQAVNQPERAAQYSQKALQFKNPTSSLHKKETRNVIPLQRRPKSPNVPRKAHKLSA